MFVMLEKKKKKKIYEEALSRIEKNDSLFAESIRLHVTSELLNEKKTKFKKTSKN